MYIDSLEKFCAAFNSDTFRYINNTANCDRHDKLWSILSWKDYYTYGISIKNVLLTVGKVTKSYSKVYPHRHKLFSSVPYVITETNLIKITFW